MLGFLFLERAIKDFLANSALLKSFNKDYSVPSVYQAVGSRNLDFNGMGNWALMNQFSDLLTLSKW